MNNCKFRPSKSLPCSLAIMFCMSFATAAFAVEYTGQGFGNSGWSTTVLAGAAPGFEFTEDCPDIPPCYAVQDSVPGTDYALVSPPITATGAPLLTFFNRIQTEARDQFGTSDAGVVEINVDGGGWVDVGTGWTVNGYDSTVASGEGNPLEGRPAFAFGVVSRDSSIPLNVSAGQTFQLRFRYASAGTVGDNNDWWVYSVRITNAQQNSADERIMLEEPIKDGIHSGIGNLRGWVVDPDGIDRVEIYIDGAFAFNAPYGGYRPDVAAAFPDVPGSADSGFSLAYGYSNLGIGTHTVTAKAVDSLGNIMEDSATFTVAAFDSLFIFSNEPVDATNSTLTPQGDELLMENVTVGDRNYDILLKWRTAEQGFEIIEIR